MTIIPGRLFHTIVVDKVARGGQSHDAFVSSKSNSSFAENSTLISLHSLRQSSRIHFGGRSRSRFPPNQQGQISGHWAKSRGTRSSPGFLRGHSHSPQSIMTNGGHRHRRRRFVYNCFDWLLPVYNPVTSQTKAQGYLFLNPVVISCLLIG